MSRSQAYAVAALVFLSLTWGYNWVLMKEALGYSAPFDFAAWRTTLGATTLVLLLAVRRRLRWPCSIWGLGVLGFFQIAIFTAATMLALVAGDPGKTSILVYTMPVWAMLFAWLLLGQKPRTAHMLATAAALVGILCMAQPWEPRVSSSSGAYALVGAAAWGFSSVYVTRLRDSGLDALSITAWSMAFGGAMLAAVALIFPSTATRWDAYFVAVLFYNSVITMALAWLLWTFVLDHLSIMTASLGVLAVPLVGSLSSALQLGERFSWIEMLGMGAILASVSSVYWRPGSRAP